MKGIQIVLAAILFSTGTDSVNAEGGTGAVDLHAVEATVGQLLEQDHFTRRKLDSSVAKQILETYLGSLDENKLFFTQEDISQIADEYSPGLGDDILLGNLTSAKNIYEIFKQRVDQRVAKINELLTRTYNFSSHRTVTANRAREPWPANAIEAERIWTEWIEKELLEEKLGTSPQPRPEAIGDRYRELQNQIDHRDDEEVLRIFLDAVAQTYDPHSEYLGPLELNEFKIDTRLTIAGIGVQIRMENGYPTIDRIFPGGPAERSRKLHIGDLIVGVAQGDGPFVDTVHSEMDKITELVLGQNGSVLHLQLISRSGKERRVVTLVRREVRLKEEEAQAELIERPMTGGLVQKLGWITVPSFYGEPGNSLTGTSVTRDVDALLKRLEQEGVQGIVIDLRNNGGGSVDEAVRMSGLFINPGPIAQLKDPTGTIHLAQVELGKALYNGPMLVLDNKLTASASEIFAAAMQDYGRAVIVGDSSSFGKGTVQAVIELDRFMHMLADIANPAGALKLTIEKIYRVTGESTQLKGVISDLTIPSFTDRAEFGESKQEHPLTYDQVAPVTTDVTGSRHPLFLDELRNRSTKRINENPAFRDLSVEIHLSKQKTSDNCVSLNEEVRRKEIAEQLSMRDQAESDRIVASAHDRTKYFRLMLADVDRSKLKLKPGTAQKHSVQDETVQSANSLLPATARANEFATTMENEAITRETLNILSDFISLNKTPLTTNAGVLK